MNRLVISDHPFDEYEKTERCEVCGELALNVPGNMEAGYCDAHRPCDCGAVLVAECAHVEMDGSECFGFAAVPGSAKVVHHRMACYAIALTPGMLHLHPIRAERVA